MSASEEARKEAGAAIAKLLDWSFRIRVIPLTPFASGKASLKDIGAAQFSLTITLQMALVFCVIPVWLGIYPVNPPYLIIFAIYGALWAGWSSGTSMLASRAVLDTIERRILPLLHESQCRALTEDIARLFPEPRTTLMTFAIGIAAATGAGFLLPHDPSSSAAPHWATLLYWCPEWFILFAAAASVVRVSTFYRLLPRLVAARLKTSLRLDPANAALIQAVAGVGRTMLLFWFGIALSVAVLLPTSTWNWVEAFSKDYSSLGDLIQALRTDQKSAPWFVLIEVPVTCFFSLGYGVIVFLFAEADLRAAARDARLATLEQIEAEAAPLLARLGTLDDAQLRRLSDLRTLQSSLAAVVPYRSIIVSGLSLVLPFLPLLSLVLPKG